MRAFVALTEATAQATVKIQSGYGFVTIDQMTVQSDDPALLDALGAAFILAATQLADAKAKVKG